VTDPLAQACADMASTPPEAEALDAHDAQYDFRTEERCEPNCVRCAKRIADADRERRAAEADVYGGQRADLSTLLGPGWLDEPRRSE
jgi:hypothetical protein